MILRMYYSVDKEANDGFGDRIVDILLNNIEIRNNEAFDHIVLSLFPFRGLLRDSDHVWDWREVLSWHIHT